jgi:hypothetical protein
MHENGQETEHIVGHLEKIELYLIPYIICAICN